MKNIDKLCHFLVGMLIAIIVTLAFSPIYGLIAGIAAGIAKEAYDEYSYGGADFFDMFVTVSGSFVGVVLYRIIKEFPL